MIKIDKKQIAIFLLFTLFSAVIADSFAFDVTSNKKQQKERTQLEVLPITGTWINLAYKDVRNKYTNPQGFDNTDSELWRAKVRELSSMGIEYLIFMEVANEGKAYYPSKIMPWWYDKNKVSPVSAILDEAAKQNMRVFMSTGWAKDQDDNLLNPAIKERQLEIMKELTTLYKNHKAFYGWYLPVEDCICPVFAEHAVQSVNTLTEQAHALTPGKKTLISPFGIGLSEFDSPEYENQLAKLKVDIIAYQDEVGCVRDGLPIPRLKKNWKRLRDIHNRLNIEMWANCETFTWENGTNDRTSALIPTAYPRLLSQQAAASAAGVDKIISFMFCGIIEDPNSNYQLGQPIWSNKVYDDYMSWKNKDKYWNVVEASFLGKLANVATPEMLLGKSDFEQLLDGEVADEDTISSKWLKLDKGQYEFVIDLKKKTPVQQVMLRMLNYKLGGVDIPIKMSILASDNNKEYDLIAVKNASLFPNNKHDAWIEHILFDSLKVNMRYIKVVVYNIDTLYMDEIYINPIVEN